MQILITLFTSRCTLYNKVLYDLDYLFCIILSFNFIKVYELMLQDERFYPSFKQHALYVRMLAELDMLKDPSFRGSDDGEGGKLISSGRSYNCKYKQIGSNFSSSDRI